jgi:hypothetical protein
MELENINSQGMNDYRWSWKKITRFCVEYFMMKKPAWDYDEYLEMIHDAVRIFLPASFYNTIDKEVREVLVSRETEAFGIIEDNIDYNARSNGYLKSDIKLVRLDFQNLPDDPKERLKYLLQHRKKFSKREIRFFFSSLFTKSKKFENFVKKFFKVVNDKIYASMYPHF